ncbi:MAG: hypothetical protein JW814_10705 [Candidatus Krumholzibacteriota bacterium]|nr:hypothetical protein [Candidatus Krumholzibacteriota bacterium]
MKVIVISGSHSNVGKTGLALKIISILEDAVHVKIGHGTRKEGLGNRFYPEGTALETVAAENNGRRYLVIESNRILREIDPDLAIFLAGGEDKPTAKEARKKADIIRGKGLRGEEVDRISESLGVDRKVALEIIRLAGSFEEEHGK